MHFLKYGSHAVFHLQSLTLLQKELDDTVKHSKTCESERDHLREVKKLWEKRETDLKYSVKMLKETCTELEQSRMELLIQLKELKASRYCVVPAIVHAVGFRRIWHIKFKVTDFVSLPHLCRQRMKQL